MMTHTLRLTATLKDHSRPSLDVTDELDEETYAGLVKRLTAASADPLRLIDEQDRLRQMLDGLAESAGSTRAELGELYDFAIEIK